MIAQAATLIGATCCIGHEWEYREAGWRFNAFWPPTVDVQHHRGYPFPWAGWREVVEEDGPVETPPSWGERLSSGNVTYPVLVAVLASTGPWAVAASLRRSPTGRTSRWVQVVCLASVVGLLFTAGDMLTGRGDGGFGFRSSEVGRFCLMTETASSVVRYWEQRRNFHLGDVTGLKEQKYTLARRMVLTDAATRAALAFAFGLVACTLVYRPWRRPFLEPPIEPTSQPIDERPVETPRRGV